MKFSSKFCKIFLDFFKRLCYTLRMKIKNLTSCDWKAEKKAGHETSSPNLDSES